MRFGRTPMPRAIVWLTILLEGTPWTYKNVCSIEEIGEIAVIEVSDGDMSDCLTIRKPDGLEEIEADCNRILLDYTNHAYDFEHIQVEMAWDYIEQMRELGS